MSEIRKMAERWWISVCPGCNGLIWPATGTQTHNETCPYRYKMFKPRDVEVVPADREPAREFIPSEYGGADAELREAAVDAVERAWAYRLGEGGADARFAYRKIAREFVVRGPVADREPGPVEITDEERKQVVWAIAKVLDPNDRLWTEKRNRRAFESNTAARMVLQSAYRKLSALSAPPPEGEK